MKLTFKNYSKQNPTFHLVSIQICSSFTLCEVIPSIFQVIVGYKFIISSFISNSGIKVPDKINKKLFQCLTVAFKDIAFYYVII